MDSRGVTPLHLALSRLRIARDSDDEGGLPLSRKKEITQIVEMVQKYLHVTRSSKDETDELERLASQLSLSETPQQVYYNKIFSEPSSAITQLKTTNAIMNLINIIMIIFFCCCKPPYLIVHQQVDEVQHLLESFTSLTIKKRHEGSQGITPLDPQPTTHSQ